MKNYQKALDSIIPPSIRNLISTTGFISGRASLTSDLMNTHSVINDLAVKTGLSSVASDYIKNYQSALNNIGLPAINDLAVKAGLSSVASEYINNYQSTLNSIGLSSMNDLAVKSGLSSVAS
ncbi:hypothetical protein CJF42_16140, partial [Pseudoalteromonas sp. NBT06-2]|uniref:hypothetical protein n=1 Tax=Pseudoalteromonas sp. NBT06-2 TaxID=2025950 RepID=UPI000BC7191F